jgi:vacuolar-type H+-ATPase subunit E/Vma4
MVTIEQKLSLFSNLLHRTMDEAFKVEMEKLRKEYEVKMQKDREAVDKEAENIINAARKRAEAERTELVSRNRVELKKEYMFLKEKYFSVLMDRLKKELETFAGSEDYTAYMKRLAGKLAALAPGSKRLEIFLAGRDCDKYPVLLKKVLAGERQAELDFKPAEDDIIGGFIAEDPENDIRIDMSLKALLEDNKSFIMQTLFQAIETGD